MQPDLLVLPLDFESPALSASATALGQPRSAGTSSGHRDRQGTRPTEQGSPRPEPSGWRLLGTHRNCVSETHGQDKPQLPEASAVIPPPGWLRPRAAGRGRCSRESRGSERSPGKGSGNPLQYSCLGNPMDRGAWWTVVHRVTKSWTRLSTHAHKCPLCHAVLSRFSLCDPMDRSSPGSFVCKNTGVCCHFLL